MKYHRPLDFGKWLNIFPSVEIGSDGDVCAEPINGPLDLCQLYHGRKYVEEHYGVEPIRPEPVDLFLWCRQSFPVGPTTRLGGVPYRPRDRPWPTNSDGVPHTFVCQFCFLDSIDVLGRKLPGDILTVMFENEESHWGGNIFTEWNSVVGTRPPGLSDCPQPSFAVPKLEGRILRFNEFPHFFDDHPNYPFDRGIAVSQSTKIGSATFFPQGDPRKPGEELICTLSHVLPTDPWAFLDSEHENLETRVDWGEDVMTLSDCGCVYFLIDRDDRIRTDFQCY